MISTHTALQFSQLYSAWMQIRRWERWGLAFALGPLLFLPLAFEFGPRWPALGPIALVALALALPLSALAWWMPRRLRSKVPGFRSERDVCAEAARVATQWAQQAATTREGQGAFRDRALNAEPNAVFARIFAVEPTRIVVALREPNRLGPRASYHRLVAVAADLQHCEDVPLAS